MRKRQLRQSVQVELRRIGLAQVAACSRQIMDRIVSLAAYKDARAVLLYGASPTEVHVDELAEVCAAAGKRVGVPRVDWARGTLTPLWAADWEEDLVAGRFKIREPREGLEAAALGDFDLIITPGLAFDEHGGRLGRGAGFYDRFLSSPERRGLLCGVCFDVQIVSESIPLEPHDVLMDAVLTESRTILVSETR